jgi:hypothetical protein
MSSCALLSHHPRRVLLPLSSLDDLSQSPEEEDKLLVKAVGVEDEVVMDSA